MGLFNFKSARDIAKEEIAAVPWNEIKTINDLEAIWEESKSRTQVIFKHSTRCGISRMAIKRFEEQFREEDRDIDVWYLDLLAHRDLSSEITARTGVHHQSPQVIAINNGNVVYHDSHHSINLNQVS